MHLNSVLEDIDKKISPILSVSCRVGGGGGDEIASPKVDICDEIKHPKTVTLDRHG
jgi:hypothetical protein